MTTFQEKQNILKDLRSLMTRVESMETREEVMQSSLPFPEETTEMPEKAKRQRLNDGSMYLRPFSNYLSRRYGKDVNIATLRGILTWAKVECNSRNSAHDWWIPAAAVKSITELTDIIYGYKTK